jgi:hypothetical protein
MRLPRWRKATWALVIWCAIILILAIAGAAGNECADESTELNRSACEAGTGIGVLLILFIGFFGFVFFSLIWLMTRPSKRQCPACGEDVRKGLRECQSCGFDFATIARGGGPVTSPPA